jgi:hypothetical protein
MEESREDRGHRREGGRHPRAPSGRALARRLGRELGGFDGDTFAPGSGTASTQAGASAAVLAEPPRLIDEGARARFPICRIYPLEQAQDAYRELERGSRARDDRAQAVSADVPG